MFNQDYITGLDNIDDPKLWYSIASFFASHSLYERFYADILNSRH